MARILSSAPIIMSDLDLTFVDRIVEQVGRGREAVIPILQRLQEHYHYLPDEALRRVSR